MHLNGDHILVSQGNYLRQIVEDLKILVTEKSSAADNLMDRRQNDDKECDRLLYFRTVYRLMYAAIRTRPDILYANVRKIRDSWKHVLRILKVNLEY